MKRRNPSSSSLKWSLHPVRLDLPTKLIEAALADGRSRIAEKVEGIRQVVEREKPIRERFVRGEEVTQVTTAVSSAGQA